MFWLLSLIVINLFYSCLQPTLALSRSLTLVLALTRTLSLTIRHLGDVGFPNVYNENVDFYQAIRQKTIPEHDGEHHANPNPNPTLTLTPTLKRT